MPHTQVFMSAAQGNAIERILDGILGSAVSVLLSGPAGAGKTVVLNAVAAKLAIGSRRVIRVSTTAERPFGMREFTAQAVRLPEAEELADHQVGQALEALACADTESDRVVLIVDGAEALLPEVFYFIQLACKTHSRLQVILAGRPELEGCLEGREFAFLRSRLAPTISLGGLSDSEAAAFIAQRLRAAGLTSKTPVADHTLATLISRGRGNPGRISAVLDRALGVPQRQTPDLLPDMPRIERAQAKPGVMRAEAGHTAHRSRADTYVGPSTSGGSHRRTYRSSWVVAALGLLGATGLVIAIPIGRAPRQSHEITALSVAPETGTSASGSADTAQTQLTAPIPANSADAEAVPATAPTPDNAAALVPPDARATVFVTSPARPAIPADTMAGDGAPSAGGTRPSAPPSSPAPAAASRSANVSKPLANAVPRAPSPERSERFTVTSTSAPDDRRCRDVLLRLQLGEEPSDADRNFLRDGCRRNR